MFSSDCVLCVLLIETYNRTIIFAGNQLKIFRRSRHHNSEFIIPNSEFPIMN